MSCDTAVEHKLCTNQIRTQTASLPPAPPQQPELMTD